MEGGSGASRGLVEWHGHTPHHSPSSQDSNECDGHGRNANCDIEWDCSSCERRHIVTRTNPLGTGRRVTGKKKGEKSK